MLLFNLNSLIATKKSKIIITIIIIISLSSIKSASNNNGSSEKIRFVFELCRHGARTPYSGLGQPNFKDYFSENWIGIKELTPIGIKQHFYLGLRNRIRYMDSPEPLLNKKYDAREILVYSTNSNRTILSANAQLQGLYLMNDSESNIKPLSKKQVLNSKPPDFHEENYEKENKKLGNYSLPFNMTIVPIHLLYSEDHVIQIQDEKNCENLKVKYDERKKRLDLNIFLEKLDHNYSELIYPLIKENLDSEIIDEKKLFSSNYSLTYYILDQIICQYWNGKPMNNIKNSFTNNENNLTIKNLYDDAIEFFKFDFLSNATGIDEEIGLYTLSPLMEILVDYMKKKVDKDVKEKDFDYKGFDIPKFLFVSAHDSTLGGLQAFFKSIDKDFDVNYAYFASNVFIELFNNKTNDNNDNDSNETNYTESDYYVRFLFDEKIIKEYKYEEFYSLIKNNVKNKFEIADFCGYNAEEVQFENGFDFYLVSTILLTCFTLALIMISINLYLKKDKIN